MQCAKLSFVIKNFEKWRDWYLTFLIEYWKSVENDFLKMCGNPVSYREELRAGFFAATFWSFFAENSQ